MTDLDHDDTFGDTTRRVSARPNSHESKAVRAVIMQNNGPDAPRTYSLIQPTTVIGRGSTCDVTLNSMELSRRHALITLNDTEINIEDLDSANGLFLNGVKIHSATLRDGDAFQIGGVVFSFRVGTQ